MKDILKDHRPDAGKIRAAIHKLIDNLVNIKDETGEFLLRLEDGRVIDTKGWAGWEWTHGVGLYGMYKYWEQSGDPMPLQIIEKWFEDRLAEGTPTKNVNTVSPFLTLAYLYEHEPVHHWLTYLDVWAEWVMKEMPRTSFGGLQHIVYNSENHEQMWDDTLMMCALPLAKIGLLLGRQDYVEEAKRQFLFHAQYLFDRESGLWFHGWTFEGRHNFGRARWARGNCWITIAIPEFIELLDLPETDAIRMFLLGVLREQVEALGKYQDESGLFHTLLDDPGSYLEASATAGFGFGILKGVRKGYLDKKHEAMGLKAVQAVMDNIDDKGELQQVSFGTAMGPDLQFYRDIPLTSMPYGQSMAILALGELLRRTV